MYKPKDGDFIKIIQPKFETGFGTLDEREFIGIFCSHVFADDKERQIIAFVKKTRHASLMPWKGRARNGMKRNF